MADAAPRYGFPPRLMRTACAAYYLGMSESAFRERVAAELPPVRLGTMTGWLREELDAWLDARAGRDAPSAAEDTWADA